MKIRDLLEHKGATVRTISPEATVSDLVAVLAEHNIGAVVVSTPDVPVHGIVSERDIVRQLARRDDLAALAVSQVMTTRVRTTSSGETVDSLRVLMTEHRIRHVPVVDDGRLVGLVSIGDVVRSAIEALEFEKDQLETYVAGGG